jgi:hypothetical protein
MAKGAPCAKRDLEGARDAMRCERRRMEAQTKIFMTD